MAIEDGSAPTDPPLVGIWSCDSIHGPGAMADDIMWFRADGTGRFDFLNLGLWSVEYFRWAQVAPDGVEIHSTHGLQWDHDAGKGLVEEPGEHPLFFGELRFSITTKPCPDGEVHEVLRLEGTPDFLPDEYGRVTWDLGDFDAPEMG